MLEQSTQNGAVYLSQEKEEKGKTKLITKSVVINRVQFGPPSPIIIHRNPYTSKILVEYPNETENNGYIYDNGVLAQRINATTNPEDDLLHYLYGVARVEDERVPYFIQNTPRVTLDDMPDKEHFTLPPTVGGYPYDTVFTYNPKLISLLGDIKATYVDKYKRPIHPAYIKRGRFFPVELDNVTTLFGELADSNKPFPVVIQLDKTDFGCIDLEPGYTDDEYELAASFDAYYVEDTPNGGKHFIVKNTDNAYKYRLSEHIEGLVNTAVTLYGINGEWLNDQPEDVSFSDYTEVGNKQRSITISDKRPDGLDNVVADITQAIEQMGSTGKRRAKRAYKTSDDESWCDFTALSRLYRFDIFPLKASISDDMLPWVLAEYGATVIPARLKHQTTRNGVPYLIYLSHKIIHNKQ